MYKYNIIIWKKSIYGNDFKCKCGRELANMNGQPNDGILLVPETRALICPKCGNIAGTVNELETSEPIDDTKPLQGDFNEFVKSRMRGEE